MMPLLEARGVTRRFASRRGRVLAVDAVDLDVFAGEMLGIVGESGSGKSTLGRLLVGLDVPTSGSVRFDGAPVPTRDGAAFRHARTRLQYLWQDPLSALNPRLTVGSQIAEVLRVHRLSTDPDARVAELLRSVALDPAHAARYPHQLSGGQRQRAVLARTLAVAPDLVVFDEPVSALDLLVQAQVVAQIAKIRQATGLTGIFISHDLRVVRYVSDRIAVMYLGGIVETGPADALFHDPRHPYTQALLSALPSVNPDRRRARVRLDGDPPDPAHRPSGCAFHPRCPLARPICAEARPEIRALGAGRSAACHVTAAVPAATTHPGIPA